VNPTISDSHTLDGSGTGAFTSDITGLNGDTTYYVRAYATNSAGIGYGNNLTFKTDPPASSYTNSLDQTFVLIPAGTFTMGSPSNELGRDSNEEPQHEVTLTQAFYMQTTEVTQAQWEAVMGYNNCEPAILKRYIVCTICLTK